MIRSGDIVRRTDLHLRCYHIGLQTEIFRISGEKYSIYCKNVPEGKFAQLSKHFDYSIKPASCWVHLAMSDRSKRLSSWLQFSFLMRLMILKAY